MIYDDDAVPFNPHTKPHPAAIAALNAVTRVLENPEIKGASILLRAANIALRYAPRLPEDPLPPGREQRYENTIRALLEELGSRSDPKRKTPLPSTIDEALASVLKHMSDFETDIPSCFSKQKHATQGTHNPGGTGVTRSVSPVSSPSRPTQASGTAVPAVSTPSPPGSCPPPPGATGAERSETPVSPCSSISSGDPNSDGCVASSSECTDSEREAGVTRPRRVPLDGVDEVAKDHGRAASGVTPVPPDEASATTNNPSLRAPHPESRSTRAP